MGIGKNYDTYIQPFSTENFRNAPLGEGAIVISRGDVIFDFSESHNILSITDEKTAANELFNVNAARKSKVDDNTAKMQSIKQLGV